jgi:hypothetical protein
MQTVIVLVIAGFYLFTGVYSFSRPAAFAATLGLDAHNLAGTNEVRAQYGGFFSAAAVGMSLPVFGLAPYSVSGLLGLVIFGGLIAGRLLALMITGEFRNHLPTVQALFLVDAVGALGSAALLM